MAALVNGSTRISRFQDSASFEHRPMMLKDFLRDDCFHSCTSSSSSNGFPKKSWKSTALVSSNKPSIVLLRSRSKKAASTTISAIHKVINVVKFLQFASVKSPLVLPSRKLPKRSKDGNVDVLRDVSEVKVKVKDILRWRSFRDLVEDNSMPLDFASSPNRSTATATATTSWCDSDFTVEELPLWCGQNEALWGKKCFLGQRNLKEDWSIFEESEQQSPVSVLDSPFREAQESISLSHPTIANVERARCMLTRRIQQLEGLTEQKHPRKLSYGGGEAIFQGVNSAEDKARELLSHLKESCSVEKGEIQGDHLILDFFMHEFGKNIGRFNDVGFESEVLRTARSWINGEYHESYEWEVESKREAYVKDMEDGVSWNKFRQEQEEMSKELEVEVWDWLIDELLADFLTK